MRRPSPGMRCAAAPLERSPKAFNPAFCVGCSARLPIRYPKAMHATAIAMKPKRRATKIRPLRSVAARIGAIEIAYVCRSRSSLQLCFDPTQIVMPTLLTPDSLRLPGFRGTLHQILQVYPVTALAPSGFDPQNRSPWPVKPGFEFVVQPKPPEQLKRGEEFVQLKFVQALSLQSRASVELLST